MNIFISLAKDLRFNIKIHESIGKLLVIVLMFFFALSGFAQYLNPSGLPIAYWDFETNANRAISETAVETQINSNNIFSGKVGGAITTVCTSTGRATSYGNTITGSAIIAGGWSTATTPGTTYFEFRFNTTGFSGIGINFDIRSDGSLANYPLAALSYSTDGGVTWAAYSANIATRNTWNNIWFAFPAAADNIADLRIRISGFYSNNSTGCTTTGTLKLDNLQLFSTATVVNAGLKNSLDELVIYTGYTSGLVNSQWLRFGTFTVNSGSTWNLTSDLAIGNTTNAGAVVVSSGGTLDFGSAGSRVIYSVAAGLSQVTLNNGGTFIIRSANGISLAGATGNVQTTTRTYGTGGNYTYANSGASYSQITGSGLPLNLTGNLTINNTSGVNLSASTTIDNPGSLILTSGKLILGTNNLRSVNISGGSASSYVCTNQTGYLTRPVSSTVVNFPVGNTAYNPSQLTNTGILDDYSVRVIDNVTDDGSGSGATTSKPVVKRTWMISEGVSGGSNVALRLYWNGSGEEINAFNIASAFMAHYVSSAGLWDNLGGVVDYSGFVETSGNTDFSPFTISSDGSFAPLPTELISFNAECLANGQGQISWKTASEHNSAYFQVEGSRDGSAWELIEELPAAGFSQNIIEYSVVDEQSNAGINYYRLSQVDLDGTTKLYDIISLDCEDENIEFRIYPNPSKGNFSLAIDGNIVSNNMDVSIYSLNGAIIEKRNLKIENGINIYHFDLNAEAGIYYLKLSDNNQVFKVMKFVIE